MTREGPEGSNPSPGAYFEDSGDIFNAGESEIQSHGMMQQPDASRALQMDPQDSPLDAVIDSITQGMSRKAIRTRLRMLARISPGNAAIVCDHILAEQTERNMKASTAESKVKTLLWLTRYLKQKPFEEMTKQDILSFLNSIRKSVEDDPHKISLAPALNDPYGWVSVDEETALLTKALIETEGQYFTGVITMGETKGVASFRLMYLGPLSEELQLPEFQAMYNVEAGTGH